MLLVINKLANHKFEKTNHFTQNVSVKCQATVQKTSSNAYLTSNTNLTSVLKDEILSFG